MYFSHWARVVSSMLGGILQSGFPYSLSSQTTNITLVPADTGAFLDNAGATGTVTHTLPPATPGLQFTFASSQLGRSLVVKAASGDVIKFAGLTAVTQSTSSGVMFACMTVTCISAGAWQVTSQVGAWT